MPLGVDVQSMLFSKSKIFDLPISDKDLLRHLQIIVLKILPPHVDFVVLSDCTGSLKGCPNEGNWLFNVYYFSIVHRHKH